MYRVAQDCSEIYGKSLTVLKVTQLSPNSYTEVEVQMLRPPDRLGPWNGFRMHHAHVQHEEGVNAWLAVIDGDPLPYHYHFYQLYGTFKACKQSLLGLLFLVETVLVYRYYRTGR